MVSSPRKRENVSVEDGKEKKGSVSMEVIKKSPPPEFKPRYVFIYMFYHVQKYDI